MLRVFDPPQKQTISPAAMTSFLCICVPRCKNCFSISRFSPCEIRKNQSIVDSFESGKFGKYGPPGSGKFRQMRSVHIRNFDELSCVPYVSIL